MAAPRNDNVKEKILDAATGLLDTQTFADISLAEIAAAAGVSKGTLYYYYKNKTDILFDLTNRYLDRQWDELIAWTGNKDKDTSVHRLVKYVVERNTASAGMRLHLIHAAMLGDEALRAKLIDRYAAFERLIAEKIAERYGVDTSDAAMRATIEKFNELCDVITEIGNFRKLPNPPITGYEFHVIQLVSEVCPHDLILPYLKETLAEIKKRKPEPEFPFRARVVVAGSEIDDPEFTKLLEGCGAMVVADRYCFGSFPSRERIEIRDGESAFDAIVRHYLHWNQCARFMEGAKIDQRLAEVKRLVDEFHADGVIYENMKFCEFWSYEKVLASHILTEEMGVPCCTIEKEYALGSVGQLRTRFQAFVESLEIKKINS